jgi:hypothetical protein
MFQAKPQTTFEELDRVLVEPMALGQLAQQRHPDKTRDSPQRTQREIATRHEWAMPRLNALRVIDDLSHCAFADRCIGIGQQGRNRRDVERSDDQFRYLFIDAPPPRDGSEDALGAGARDDLQKICVGEKRRIFQDGNADSFIDIGRKFQNHILRHARVGFDLGRENFSYPDQLILGQPPQCLQSQLADALTFGGHEIGEEPADLLRQLGPHIVIIIVGENSVGCRGCRRIGRYFAAGLGCPPFGDIIEHLRLGIGAGRKLRFELAFIGFQNLSRFFVRELIGQLLCLHQASDKSNQGNVPKTRGVAATQYPNRYPCCALRER